MIAVGMQIHDQRRRSYTEAHRNLGYISARSRCVDLVAFIWRSPRSLDYSVETGAGLVEIIQRYNLNAPMCDDSALQLTDRRSTSNVEVTRAPRCLVDCSAPVVQYSILPLSETI